MDATRLADLIARKELSPVEVVEAHLDRISEVNPKLNAIVTVADGARTAARQAEAAIMSGEKVGPLHGVPFTVKDVIDTAGVLTQRASPIFRGRVPDKDAPAVARMKAAGAILLAKTNAPEFAFSIETDNLLTGRTNNPWNLDYTPGGSSGGESAAIAADSPPDEPPGVRSRFQGLLVRPVRRLSVSVQAENSVILVFASGMPPAALKRVTAVASLSGMKPANNLEPRWLGMPAVSSASLMVKGTPCSGPSSAPSATALSAASAPLSASSATRVTIALILGFTSAMRSRCAWTTSRDESCFVRIRDANAVASRK